MIGGARVLGLVTARGGSKRLPGKNLRPLAGRPLIAWTIAAARNCRYLDRLVLSSDDPAIMQAAADLGCEVPFQRPAELATDQATSLEVVRHALMQLPGYDILLLLQPTSPLRTGADLDAALERLHTSGAGSCVSVSEPHPSPYWCFAAREDGRLRPLLPDLPRPGRAPRTWALNGALYAVRTRYLDARASLTGEDCIPYPMPAERSVDIDTALDWALAELLLHREE
jgi:CMP-N,N'-diacetyllegionaminic acid synthase